MPACTAPATRRWCAHCAPRPRNRRGASPQPPRRARCAHRAPWQFLRAVPPGHCRSARSRAAHRGRSRCCCLPRCHSAVPRDTAARAAPPRRNHCRRGTPSPPPRAARGACTASTWRSASTRVAARAPSHPPPTRRTPRRAGRRRAWPPRSRARGRPAPGSSTRAPRAACRTRCDGARGESPGSAPRASSPRPRPRCRSVCGAPSRSGWRCRAPARPPATPPCRCTRFPRMRSSDCRIFP